MTAEAISAEKDQLNEELQLLELVAAATDAGPMALPQAHAEVAAAVRCSLAKLARASSEVVEQREKLITSLSDAQRVMLLRILLENPARFEMPANEEGDERTQLVNDIATEVLNTGFAVTGRRDSRAIVRSVVERMIAHCLQAPPDTPNITKEDIVRMTGVSVHHVGKVQRALWSVFEDDSYFDFNGKKIILKQGRFWLVEKEEGDE